MLAIGDVIVPDSGDATCAPSPECPSSTIDSLDVLPRSDTEWDEDGDIDCSPLAIWQRARGRSPATSPLKLRRRPLLRDVFPAVEDNTVGPEKDCAHFRCESGGNISDCDDSVEKFVSCELIDPPVLAEEPNKSPASTHISTPSVRTNFELPGSGRLAPEILSPFTPRSFASQITFSPASPLSAIPVDVVVTDADAGVSHRASIVENANLKENDPRLYPNAFTCGCTNLGTRMVNTIVDVSLSDLFDFLFLDVAEARMLKETHSAWGSSDLKIGYWMLSNERPFKRVICFKHSFKTLLGTIQTRFSEEQFLNSRETHHVLLKSQWRLPNLPNGNAFLMKFAFCFNYVSSSKCHFQIFGRVEFDKPVIFEDKIQQSAIETMFEYSNLFLKIIEARINSSTPQQISESLAMNLGAKKPLGPRDGSTMLQNVVQQQTLHATLHAKSPSARNGTTIAAQPIVRSPNRTANPVCSSKSVFFPKPPQSAIGSVPMPIMPSSGTEMHRLQCQPMVQHITGPQKDLKTMETKMMRNFGQPQPRATSPLSSVFAWAAEDDESEEPRPTSNVMHHCAGKMLQPDLPQEESRKPVAPPRVKFRLDAACRTNESPKIKANLVEDELPAGVVVNAKNRRSSSNAVVGRRHKELPKKAGIRVKIPGHWVRERRTHLEYMTDNPTRKLWLEDLENNSLTRIPVVEMGFQLVLCTIAVSRASAWDVVFRLFWLIYRFVAMVMYSQTQMREWGVTELAKVKKMVIGAMGLVETGRGMNLTNGIGSMMNGTG
ncbi:hypothetical protein HDU83_005223 [Entophlyctis luteolus]|nr:hypothetical protein HDU83_005223 [Entophlyctis luteolus]